MAKKKTDNRPKTNHNDVSALHQVLDVDTGRYNRSGWIFLGLEPRSKVPVWRKDWHSHDAKQKYPGWKLREIRQTQAKS